jgi:hypothetical protein
MPSQSAVGRAAHPRRVLKLGIEISQATVAKYTMVNAEQ